MVGRIRDPLTGAVLRASGKKDSRNEDRDANPLNDSIPGEVVRRNEKSTKSGPSTKALAETDMNAVLSKGSGTREKWMKKALQQVQDGDLQAVDIYNIIKVPDFASDLKEKTGRSMYKFLMSRISVFSKGQQRFLAKECPLAQMFGGGEGASLVTASNPSDPEAAEEMMARVRQFVRQQQGVELDQAVNAVSEPPPAPVEPVARQDASAVASIIARASSTAASRKIQDLGGIMVNYQAAKAVQESVVEEEKEEKEEAPKEKVKEASKEKVKKSNKERRDSSSPSRKKRKKKKHRSSSSRSRSRSRSRDRRRR